LSYELCNLSMVSDDFNYYRYETFDS